METPCYLQNKEREEYTIIKTFVECDLMRICELREKEVINLCDCKRLGCVMDLDFDLCTGCVRAVIVPVCDGFCGLLGNEKEYVIPLECIVKIGPDFIMVEMQEGKYLKKV